MKKLIQFAAMAVCAVLIPACSISVSPDNKENPDKNFATLTSASFKVWGNCEMCKETIEGSLSIPGVSKSDWNPETKKITISYDSTKINLDQIQKSIASVGYDTEKYRGNDSAYAGLHECCQYERKEQ